MLSEYFTSRLPLFYVFLSGIGFSLQTLIIKLLAEDGFHGSFQCVFFRGVIQLFLSAYYIYWDEERRAGKGPNLFGNTSFIKLILFLRAFTGFGGIAFSFLAVELISIGDSTVLCMLSPLIASILGYLMLGEPWRIPEFCATIVSLVGAVMVAKPPILFGNNGISDVIVFYTGVMYALIASISAAFAYIFVRILGTSAKMPWANVCFSQAIGQIVLAIPSLYIFGQKLSFIITKYQFAMIILGGVIGAVSQILMTIGMQREKSAAATAMRMSDVAFGYIWQVLFTVDKLNLLSLGGALLISSSILIIVLFKQSNRSGDENVTSTDNNYKHIELSTTIVNLDDMLKESYDLEPGFEDDDCFRGEDTIANSTCSYYDHRVPEITITAAMAYKINASVTEPNYIHNSLSQRLQTNIISPILDAVSVVNINGNYNNYKHSKEYNTLSQADEEFNTFETK